LVFLGYRRIQIREGNSRKWLYSRETPAKQDGASGDKGAEMVTRETLQKPGLSPQAPQAPSDHTDSPCARAGEVYGGHGDDGDTGDSGDVTVEIMHVKIRLPQRRAMVIQSMSPQDQVMTLTSIQVVRFMLLLE
jgi:hypothetical protein